MVYEINDLKGILILVLFGIPMITSTNIDCSGKAFHCVNSTHFMICVDLGGGVSTTIDDFVIPCPPTTECHEYNIFECEFPKIETTTSPLQVIRISKQSDTSVTTSVIYSVTDKTPPDDILSVLQENVTVATLSVPEEVTPVLKLEVLENLKQLTGVKSVSPTETSITIQVTSSPSDTKNEIVNGEQTNNKTKETTSTTDNNNKIESALETSIDKAVTASLADTSKSIDMATSVIGLNHLISIDPQSAASTKSYSDVITTFNTSYDTSTTTIDPYTTKQATLSNDKYENVRNQISTNPVDNTYIEIFHKDSLNNNQNDSVIQNFANQNLMDEITTTEQVPESNTKYFAPVKFDFISEPVTVLSPQTTTEKTFIPLELVDIISNDSQDTANTSSPSDVITSLNILNNNITIMIDPYTTQHATTSKAKNENVTDQISMTPVLNTYIEIFHKYSLNNNQNDSVIQNFTHQIFMDEISTTEQIPETNTENFAPDKIDFNLEPVTAGSPQTTTEKTIVPLELVDIISNDSQGAASTSTPSGVITSLNTSNNNITIMVDPYTTQRATISEVKNENVADQISISPVVNTYIQTFNKDSLNIETNYKNQNDSVNLNFANQNFIHEITTTEQVPETHTKYFVSSQVDFTSEPVTVVSPQITTEKNFVPLGLVDLISIDSSQSSTSPSSTSDIITSLNTSHDFTATTIDPYITTQRAITSDDKNEKVTDQISITPVVTTYIQTFQNDSVNNKINYNSQNDSIHQNFSNKNSIAEIPTTKQVPETDTEIFVPGKINFISESVTVVTSQTTTEFIVPLTTEENIIYTTTATPTLHNGSLVEENATSAHILEIIKTTDSPIEFSDSSYQINQESNKPLIETNNYTTYSNNTTETPVYNASSTDIFHDKVTKPVLILTSSIEKTAVEVLTTETLQNDTTVYKIEEKHELSATTVPLSVDPIHAPNVVNTLDGVPKTIQPQPPLSNHYATGFTTYTPEIVLTTPISIDSVRTFEQVEQVSNNIPEIADINNVYTKNYTNSTSPLNVTRSTNMEQVTDLFITTVLPQEPIIQQMDTNKQTNISRISTDTISTVDPDEKVNKNETMKSINGKNYTLPSSAANTYNDESIKIVSLLETLNSSVNSLSNRAMNPSNSMENNLTNLSLSDDYIKTTKEQDSSVDMTTTKYNSGSKLTQVGESVKYPLKDLPKSSQTTEYLPILSTTSTETSPIKEINTENVKYVISTEASLSNTTRFGQINPSKTTDYILLKEGTSTDHSILPYEEKEASTSGSALTTGIAVSYGGLKAGPVYDEDTTIKTTDSIKSWTQIIPLAMPQDLKDNNIDPSRSSLITSEVMDTETIKSDNTDSSLPISEVPPSQLATEPTRKTYVFSQTTLAPMAVAYSDDLPGIKTTDLPLQQLSTANYGYLQSISDTTETVINLVTEPDSMVETIKVNGRKISETSHGDMIFSDVMFNNGTVNNIFNYNNKSVNNIIDHENVAIGSTSQSNTQNTTNISKKSVVINNGEDENYTEKDLIGADINKNSVKDIMLKINDSSIEEESTSESLVFKSDMDLQNNTLLTDLPLAEQITQDVKTVNILIYELTAVTTSPSHAIETESLASIDSTQSKTVTEENESANTDILVNTNIKISDDKQVQTNSRNISDSYNTSNPKVNVTTSYINLLLHNSKFMQHLTSTNHTITAETQSHFNESDKQSNATSNELKLRATSMHNPNVTNPSIHINAASKDKITNNLSASLFNCFNHTRGKYADKKDCRKFYTCVGKLQPIIGTCPNNTVFSEINKLCTRNLSHCVRNNQFRCLFEGRFSDFFKDNIYYICVKNRINGFVRYKLQCQSDYHLNKATVKCEKKLEISSQSASSVSENSKINTEESKPKIKLEESTIDFECESEGKFPHAVDCTKYYVCTKIKDVYRRKIKKCASEEVYDKKKKKCVEETDSSEC